MQTEARSNWTHQQIDNLRDGSAVAIANQF
jgi:hypothetical protein